MHENDCVGDNRSDDSSLNLLSNSISYMITFANWINIPEKEDAPVALKIEESITSEDGLSSININSKHYETGDQCQTQNVNSPLMCDIMEGPNNNQIHEDSMLIDDELKERPESKEAKIEADNDLVVVEAPIEMQTEEIEEKQDDIAEITNNVVTFFNPNESKGEQFDGNDLTYKNEDCQMKCDEIPFKEEYNEEQNEDMDEVRYLNIIDSDDELNDGRIVISDNVWLYEPTISYRKCSVDLVD